MVTGGGWRNEKTDGQRVVTIRGIEMNGRTRNTF